MAEVRAFSAIRPLPALAHLVSAPPYDVMNESEAREMACGNAVSFLHVSRSEIDLPTGTDPYGTQVYEKARDNLQKMLADGVLIREDSPCLYIYRLEMDGRAQTGLAACLSVDDYLSGVIKKHELTRADKEDDRTRHIECCNANTGPVFIAYREDADVRHLLNEWMETNKPLYDFTSDDGIGHRVWRIDDGNCISSVQAAFANRTLYIADGHHRNASAARVAQNRRLPGTTHDKEHDYYLAVLFPDEDLRIMDYNRVVKDLNGNTPEEFLRKLAEKFEVTPGTREGVAAHIHRFGMYLRDEQGSRWYQLTAKAGVLENKDEIGLLDVSILQDEVLDAILGIRDPRSDKRIDFVGGIRGRAGLEARVDSGEMQLAFAMYPTSMDELMRIADQEKIMPPKSTWFEPKLRSGLFVHALS